MGPVQSDEIDVPSRDSSGYVSETAGGVRQATGKEFSQTSEELCVFSINTLERAALGDDVRLF